VSGSIVKSLIHKALESRGQIIITKAELDNRIADIPKGTLSFYRRVEPFTMTSLARIAGLLEATKYLVEANIQAL
jgi:hypothetical protein